MGTEKTGRLVHEWRYALGQARARCMTCGATWTSYWYGRGNILEHCPGPPVEPEIKVELGGRGE